MVDLGAGSFSPLAGDSFDILDWGSLSGSLFRDPIARRWAALSLGTRASSTRAACSVSFLPVCPATTTATASSTLPTTRSGATPLAKPARAWPPMGTANGVIDSGDYDVWKANFGNHSGSGCECQCECRSARAGDSVAVSRRNPNDLFAAMANWIVNSSGLLKKSNLLADDSRLSRVS